MLLVIDMGKSTVQDSSPFDDLGIAAVPAAQEQMKSDGIIHALYTCKTPPW